MNGLNRLVIRAKGQDIPPHAEMDSRTEITKLLLEYGANVNAQDSDGDTPLHRAAEYNLLPLISILLEWDADPLSVNCQAALPVLIALMHGFKDTANLMFNQSVLVNSTLARWVFSCRKYWYCKK